MDSLTAYGVSLMLTPLRAMALHSNEVFERNVYIKNILLDFLVRKIENRNRLREKKIRFVKGTEREKCQYVSPLEIISEM